MSNREELTRQAEKCLRQGRMDEAIAHYQELAHLTPVDWGLVKQLADLLERAGQREGAARQFARWADHLFAEGFHSKASALYKKVLKLEAFDEHALWQLAEVSVALKLRADARLAYQRVAEMRLRRGDAAGAAVARERLADLDVTPPGGGPAPAMPRAYAPPEPLVPSASATGAPAPGVPIPPASMEAAPALPSPETVSARLARLRREAEDADARHAPDADQKWLAVLDAQPADVALRLRLVQAAIDRRDLAGASQLAVSLDPSETPSLVALVELAHRQGRPDAVDRLIAGRIHAGTPAQAVLTCVDVLAARDIGVARAALVAAVTAWTAAGQPGYAAGALEQAAARGLLTTALYLQWVEICVDAGLPALSSAQAALARAYLADQRLAEARVVAEDVFVREGGAEPARALLLDVLDHQGIADPHQVLVDLLTPPSERVADDATQGIDLNVASSADPGSDAWSFATLQQDSEPNRAADTPTLEQFSSESEPEYFEIDVESPALSTDLVAPAGGPLFDWADLLGRDVAARLAVSMTPHLDGPGTPAVDQDIVFEIIDSVEPPDVEPAEATPEPAFEPDAPVGASPSAQAGDSIAFDPDVLLELPDFDEARSTPPAASLDIPPVAMDDSEEGDVAVVAIESAVPVVEPVSPEAPPAVGPHDGDGRAEPMAASPAAPSSPEQDTPPRAERPLFADPPAPRIGDLRGQPFFAEDAPLQPSFSMPTSWLSDAPAALTPDAPRRREPGDDFFFDDDATPPRWATPPVRGAASSVPTQPPVDLTEPVSEPTPIEPLVDETAVSSSPDERPADLHLDEAAELPDGGRTDQPELVDVEEEVDLTQLLEELKQWDPALPAMMRHTPAAAPAAALPLSPVEPEPRGDVGEAVDALPEPLPATPHDGRAELDAAFADLQRHADDRTVAEQQLAAGRVFLAAGLASEAARAFERASTEPRARFEASLSLGDLHKSRGQLLEAVGWYEQAAGAPVPDAAVKRAVLYDLAESLEALGETDRALGVLLDLLSEVEDYRDARARLDRLLRVDAGG